MYCSLYGCLVTFFIYQLKDLFEFFLQPLALVTWGHRLEISKVSMEVIVDFIKNHALKGPEEIADDGQYNLLLGQQAKIVSDKNDTNLCPFYGLSNVESM